MGGCNHKKHACNCISRQAKHNRRVYPNFEIYNAPATNDQRRLFRLSTITSTGVVDISSDPQFMRKSTDNVAASSA